MSSTVAIWIGRPLPRRKRFCRAASNPHATSGSPSSTSASLAVVPPMSKASTRPSPALRPNQAPASAPAAGPLSSSCTGARLASATWVSPPFDSMRNKSAAHAELTQRGLQTIEISVRERPHIGVGDRRHHAGIFADLGRDIAGERQRQAGEAPGDRLRDRDLVGRVRISVQEHDCQALHALAQQRIHLAQRTIDIERGHLDAIRAEAACHLATPRPAHQRLRHLDEQVIELVFPLARDLQDIRESGRRQQAGRGAGALDERVGEQGRGMDHPPDRCGRDRLAPEQMAKSGNDAARRIVRRGGFLPDHGAAVERIENDQIREGAADIDAKGERTVHQMLSTACWASLWTVAPRWVRLASRCSSRRVSAARAAQTTKYTASTKA